MGELKNIAESGQIWELIFPQSFVKNTHNFAQSCVNSPRISEKLDFEEEKTEQKNGEEGKKHVAVVC